MIPVEPTSLDSKVFSHQVEVLLAVREAYKMPQSISEIDEVHTTIISLICQLEPPGVYMVSFLLYNCTNGMYMAFSSHAKIILDNLENMDIIKILLSGPIRIQLERS